MTFNVNDRVFFRPASFIGADAAMRKRRGKVVAVRRIPGFSDEITVKWDRERGTCTNYAASLCRA